jgi:beta-lactamase class A
MKIVAALPFVFWLSLPLLSAQTDSFAVRDEKLQVIIDTVVKMALNEFAAKKLQSNQLAVTLVNLRDPKNPGLASYHGGTATYPASVIKLFYLAAAHRWMEDGKLKDTAELRRAMRDMIVDSSNDATHYVLDALTDTTSGPELSNAEMKTWGEKRNAVNRYFASLGYTNINANQKPWNDGPYGRERIWVGKEYGNRNALTTYATARLFTEIVLGHCISPERCEQMMKLLARDPFGKTSDPNDQAHGFTGSAIPAGAKLFSKAGWTSTTRHDAAYIELPDGRKLVLVTFTTGHANERGIIPFIAKQVIEQLH